MVSPGPEGTGSVSSNLEGAGSVSSDPEGVGSVSSDPSRGEPASLDPKGTDSVLGGSIGPTRARTVSNHYGYKSTDPGSNF